MTYPWNKGLKGIHLNTKTEIKKGQHLSRKTEFKKGQRYSPETEFKKGIRTSPSTEFTHNSKTAGWRAKVECKLCKMVYALRFSLRHLRDFHPRLFRKRQKLAYAAAIKRHPDLQVRAGNANVESGQVFFAQKGLFSWHGSGAHQHYHRSEKEKNYCKELLSSIGAQCLHPNLRFKGIEIDWVVSKIAESFDALNPKTWAKVIEYHPWDKKRTLEEYKQRRLHQFRSRGITCRAVFVTN